MTGLDCNLIGPTALQNHPAKAVAVQARVQDGKRQVFPSPIIDGLLLAAAAKHRFSPPPTTIKAPVAFSFSPPARRLAHWSRAMMSRGRRCAGSVSLCLEANAFSTLISKIFHTAGVHWLLIFNWRSFALFDVF